MFRVCDDAQTSITRNIAAMQKPPSSFFNFVNTEEGAGKVLPLVHIVSAYRFRSLIEYDKLIPQHCQNFGEKLIYLFYGRPAYKTENAEFFDLMFNWPIVFIFDHTKVQGIAAVYPFDTGAFFLGLYRRFFSKDSKVSDFTFPGSLEYAEKLSQAFYLSNYEYMHGKSTKNINASIFDFETAGVQRLSKEPSYTERAGTDQVVRDERSNSIEVQVTEEILIKEAARAVIVPQQCLQVPEVVTALERWDIGTGKLKIYEPFSSGGMAGISSQINIIVSNLYKEWGLLD